MRTTSLTAAVQSSWSRERIQWPEVSPRLPGASATWGFTIRAEAKRGLMRIAERPPGRSVVSTTRSRNGEQADIKNGRPAI